MIPQLHVVFETIETSSLVEETFFSRTHSIVAIMSGSVFVYPPRRYLPGL